MLRDNLEIALNELIVALREATQSYEGAARRMKDPQLLSCFTEAARSHAASAEALEDQQRQLGYLPQTVDEERTLLREAVSQVRAIVVEDERVTLLREREPDEQRIMTCCEAALALELPDSLRELVRQTHRDTVETIERLKSLLKDLTEAG